MRVILQKDIPNLGDAGEIKEVANGYARNFLLPRKLVIPARAGSARAALHQQKIVKLKTEKRLREMNEMAGRFGGVKELVIPVRVGAKSKLFGSVTSRQIVAALQEQGYDIDKRKIDTGEKIRSLGKHKIRIRLAENIVIPLDIEVVPDEESIATLEEEAQAAEQLEKVTAAAAQKAADAEAYAGENAAAGEAAAAQKAAEAKDIASEEDASGEEAVSREEQAEAGTSASDEDATGEETTGES